jgi:hypothetical protein
MFSILRTARIRPYQCMPISYSAQKGCNMHIRWSVHSSSRYVKSVYYNTQTVCARSVEHILTVSECTEHICVIDVITGEFGRCPLPV